MPCADKGADTDVAEEFKKSEPKKGESGPKKGEIFNALLEPDWTDKPKRKPKPKKQKNYSVYTSELKGLYHYQGEYREYNEAMAEIPDDP